VQKAHKAKQWITLATGVACPSDLYFNEMRLFLPRQCGLVRNLFCDRMSLSNPRGGGGGIMDENGRKNPVSVNPYFYICSIFSSRWKRDGVWDRGNLISGMQTTTLGDSNRLILL